MTEREVLDLRDDRVRVKRLTTERDEARAALDDAVRRIATVRALHSSTVSASGFGCAGCGHFWPCATLRALDLTSPLP